MSNQKEFQQLASIKAHAGFKKLTELWLAVVTDIEQRRDVAASRGQESAWRYYAGMEKGAKRIVTCLDETLMQMEVDGGDIAEEPSEVIAKLLDEARGEKTK